MVDALTLKTRRAKVAVSQAAANDARGTFHMEAVTRITDLPAPRGENTVETSITRCAKVSAPRIALVSIVAVPVAILLQLLPVSAFAGTTIQLPVPYSVGATYFYRMAIVTGFSDNGNYVIAESTGSTVTGHSGRGSTTHTTYECVQWTWDLAGNVVNEAVLNSLQACPALDPTRQFTNTGGYSAWTTVYQYYPATHFPMLTSP